MATAQVKRPCTVVLHDDRISTQDVLCGARILLPGDLGYLSASGVRTICIAPATIPSGVIISSEDVSLHVSLAERFGFENRLVASVSVVEDAETAMAMHVEVFFRDHWLSRADMWQMMRAVDETVLYRGQALSFLGSPTAEVRRIYIKGTEVDSAFVAHPQTKLIFRSGSARFTILVEVSREMLEDWSGGELMYEKCISGYLLDLFQRWATSKMKHQVTVVLYGRLRSPPCHLDQRKLDGSHPSHQDDFYHVVASGIPSTSWPLVLRKLRKAFGSASFCREMMPSAESNILEAIQLAAIDFSDDQTDTTLLGTGASIIVVTAGAGLFQADHHQLKQMTDLLIGNSIGVDLVALSPKPLHPVPLFRYSNNKATEFALPHWVDISFWERPDFRRKQTSTWTLPGLAESVMSVALPLLPLDNAQTHERHHLESYDGRVFEKHLGPSDRPAEHQRDASYIETGGSMETVTNTSHSPRLGQANSTKAALLTLKFDLSNPKPPSADLNSTELSLERVRKEHLPRSTTQISRKISLGPRGLAPGRSMASTTISSAHARHEKDLLPAPFPSASDTSSNLAKVIRASLARKTSQQSLVSHRISDPDPSNYTKPINIQTGVDAVKDEDNSSDPASLVEKGIADSMVGPSLDQVHGSTSATPKGTNFLELNQSSKRHMRKHESLDLLSPWVMLLNPCDPRRDNMHIASQYRKWQHIFPRAVSSGSFKWTSMCSPGSLPLTAEYRPTASELETHYNKKVRRHVISNSVGLQHDTARNLVDRLVDIRLLRGFQIVAITSSSTERTFQTRERPVLLARGRIFHEVQRLSDFEVQLVQYEPRTSATSNGEALEESSPDVYNPKISIDGEASVQAEIPLPGKTVVTDWSALDEHILGLSPQIEQAATFKTRLVLLPIDSAKFEQTAHSRWRELSDDERRIEGIQRLTQMWQRQRLFKPEDQQHQASLVRPNQSYTKDITRDPNPLAIEFDTRDLSIVVSSQGLRLSNQTGHAEIASDLFAESEKHHSTNFDVPKLAKQMQEMPPYGVEMRDRRWLTVNHLKCFRGDEMTSWLLGVFKDLNLREDAVALGNELMNRGVFAHVRQKHIFRDGHYFYQITSAYRTTDYPDTTGLFSKAPWRSIPSTPLADLMASPMLRPISGDSSSSEKSTPTTSPLDTKRIILSQQIQFNVDPSRSSERTQMMELHYDRIHNPYNCYHIHLEWLGTSAKLIRESVERWTSQMETYGLKLVQIPLQEVSKYHETHPFDQPHTVRLALRPPNKPLATPLIEPHGSAWSPRGIAAEDSAFPYHKALLRRHGFVLDFEAASAFSNKLQVAYSWGPLTYAFAQFVHRSGLVLVQIVGGDDHAGGSGADFLLLPNRLAPARFSAAGRHRDAAGSGSTSAESIISDFRSFCNSTDALSHAYRDIDQPRPSAEHQPSPYRTSTMADGDIPPIQLPPHLIHSHQPTHLPGNRKARLPG